eukprot:3426253-Lingulodinium_polyedra.AAC.1
MPSANVGIESNTEHIERLLCSWLLADFRRSAVALFRICARLVKITPPPNTGVGSEIIGKPKQRESC